MQILTVGSLDQPYKGVSELISACAELVASGLSVELKIAGTGRLQPELEAFARQVLPGGVEFLGHLSGKQLARAYDLADLFVLASWTEGLPRVLVEAMLSGLPAICTQVGGVPELVSSEFLVPPRDPKALAAKIQSVLQQPEYLNELGQKNRHCAEEFLRQSEEGHRAFLTFMIESFA